jgi:hypothetical protein
MEWHWYKSENWYIDLLSNRPGYVDWFVHLGRFHKAGKLVWMPKCPWCGGRGFHSYSWYEPDEYCEVCDENLRIPVWQWVRYQVRYALSEKIAWPWYQWTWTPTDDYIWQLNDIAYELHKEQSE